MCIATVGKIKSIEGKKVMVEYPDKVRQVLVGDEKVKVGDWVLVQMGIIIKILTPQEAKERLL